MLSPTEYLERKKEGGKLYSGSREDEIFNIVLGTDTGIQFRESGASFGEDIDLERYMGRIIVDITTRDGEKIYGNEEFEKLWTYPKRPTGDEAETLERFGVTP